MLGVLLPLTLSLFILMFAYNAVEAILPLETYGTDFYKYATLSLSIVYLSLTVFSLASGYLVNIKPAGTLIILGPLGYFAFSLSLLEQNGYLWIVSATFLGATASIYWICIKALVFREVEKSFWGRAFGTVGFIATLGGGLGPFVLFKILSGMSDVARASAVLSLISIMPLFFLLGKGRDFKNFQKLSLGVLKNKLFLFYIVASFALSVYLPFVIVVAPYIAGNEEILGEYRLLSYAIPSTLSLVGGILYDRYRGLLPLLLLPSVFSTIFIEKNLLFMGFLLTASVSLATPGIQAMLGEIIPKKDLGVALGIASFVAGVGTSFNIYFLGYLISIFGLISALAYTSANLLACAVIIGYIIKGYLWSFART